MKLLRRFAPLLVALPLCGALPALHHPFAAAAAPAPVLSVEAESPANVLRGAAKVYPCPTCSGGKVVRWIGYGGSLNMVLMLPKAGAYTLKIDYTNGFGPRNAFVRVNFDVPARMAFASTMSWRSVRTRTFTAHLDAGLNHLAFTNPAGWCPDVDKVVVLH